MLAASSFIWLEPELLRIQGLILKETKGAFQAEQALRKAVECAQALAFPVLERRCLVSRCGLLGPAHHDLEMEARLEELAYLGDLPQRVSRIMSIPAELLKSLMPKRHRPQPWIMQRTEFKKCVFPTKTLPGQTGTMLQPVHGALRAFRLVYVLSGVAITISFCIRGWKRPLSCDIAKDND